MYHLYIILGVQLFVLLYSRRLPTGPMVFVSLFFVTITLSLRDPFFGYDTPTYVKYFLSVESLSDALFGRFFWKAEYTFFFLGGVLSKLSSSAFWVVFGFSACCNTLIGLSILKLKNIFGIDPKFILISIMATSTFYLFEVNVLRQFLALSIFLFWFTHFYLTSRFFDLSGLILAILSIFSHNSIIVLFVIPCGIYLFIEKRWFLLSLITLISMFFINYAMLKINAYSTIEFETSANYPIKAIAILCHLSLLTILTKWAKPHEKRILIFLWVSYFVEIFVSIITGWKAAERLHMYNVILALFVTPIYIKKIRSNFIFYVFLLSFYVMCLCYTVFVLTSNSLQLLVRY